MATPNANITISFTSVVTGADGEDTDSTIDLEVNEADQADGDTTFLFGDTAIYRVYKGSRIASISVINSAGTEKGVSTGNTAVITDEVVTFVASNTANTQHIVDSGLTATLVGGAGVGSISWTAGSSLLTGSLSDSETSPLVGVYLVSYTTRFDKRSLSNVTSPAGWPADEEYPVVVVVVGTLSS